MRTNTLNTMLQGMALVGLLVQGACGGGGSATGGGNQGTAGTLAVTLVNPPSSVDEGGSIPLTAQVTGSTDVGVVWAVDSIVNGNASVGTISGTGNTVTYTAPLTPGSYTITATSTANAAKQSSATIRVKAKVAISLSPGNTTAASGSAVAFTAAVTGATDTSVLWSVDGIAGGDATVGSIAGAGSTVSYTVPASGSHTLTATAAADATKSASSVVTVQAPVAVALSPSSASLNTGGTVSLTASVSGTTNTAVAWSVDGIAGGSSTVGTISGTGSTVTYTAPATAGSHSVTAVSAASSTATASCAISVLAPAPVAVTLSPGAITLSTSGTTSFTAVVTGLANTAVTWSVDGIAGGSSTVGTISGAGSTVVYTAPAASGTHTVVVTSAADLTKSASSIVTVQAAAAVTGVIVAPNGVLGNPGTLAAPTTLEGARTLIQNASRATAGALRVYLRGGIYPRSSTFTLGSADSGSAANPVEYDAYPGETPRLIGGVSVSPSAAHLVDSTDPNWSRLDSTARSMIYVVDLTAYKASIGTLASRMVSGGSVNQAMEVFVDGAPLTSARYPKAVDASTVNLAPAKTIRVTGTLTPDVTGDYTYKGLDSLGRPYYQLAKNGDVWSIAASATAPDWHISNRKDLGGTGSPLATWGTWETFNGPAGNFDPLSGASGKAFLAPADGSSPLPGFMLIRSTNGTTTITAPDSHLSRWRASEAMYYGLGYYSWSGSHSTLSAINATTGTLTLSATPTYGLRPGQPFFVYNLLEELTAPGEYFIDAVNARLYLRPNGDVPPAEILLSTLQGPVVQMSGCQYISWHGVSFEAAKDRLVYATSCQNVGFTGCTFKNAGGYGLLLNGSSNLVEACDFRQLGKGGVWVSGGNRMSLTPSGTLIENSQFQYFGRLFWTYMPAINIQSFSDSYNSDAIGFTVQHNEIHHSPHAAILYSGNGNIIKYNLIHDATQWTNDAGVIYTTGREWGTQGNLIQFNLIRNCGSPLGTFLSGIYIDGVGSGVKVEGNILYKAAPQFAIQHNGGRDVQTKYNICYGQWYGVDISNVAFAFVNNTAGSSWNLLDKLLHFNYQTAPWSTAYPDVASIPNLWTSLAGTHWLEPEGSVCYGNLQYGSSPDVYRQHNYYTSLAAPTSWFSQVGGNLSQVDPQFTDPANGNFSLKSTSPMFSVPGFPGIDVTQIGIQH